MPQVGELQRGRAVNLRPLATQFIWAACSCCGRERWVRYSVKRSEPYFARCRRCERQGKKMLGADGKGNNWQSGHTTDSGGYVHAWIPIDDFFYPMATRGYPSGGYVREHRLVMAQSLGRCLLPWEQVHHRNGIKTDNRIENLELTMLGGHGRLTETGYKAGYQHGLQDGRDTQIKELKKEMRMLRWMLSLLLEGRQIGQEKPLFEEEAGQCAVDHQKRTVSCPKE